MDIAYNPRFLVPKRVLRKTSAGIEIACCIDGKHFPRTTPVLVVVYAIHGMTYMLLEERTTIVLIEVVVNDSVCQLNQLVLKQFVIALLPYIFKYTVDIHLLNAQVV